MSKILELSRIGLVEEENLDRLATRGDLVRLVNKINLVEEEVDLGGDLDDEFFLETAGELLGLEVEDIELERLGRSYSFRDLYEGLHGILSHKNKDGFELLEVKINEGFLRDYNEAREVPEILVFNGKTQPIFDCDKALFETVYIETPLDTDCDGKRDLIATFIRRPLETTRGMKVPVIYISNPYMMETNDDLYVTHNVDEDLYVMEETDIDYESIKFTGRERVLPEPREVKGMATNNETKEVKFDTTPEWYKYFLARGYAVVYSGGIGTRYSEGIRTCGSEEETISTVSVIDWLNGRLRAFTNKRDNIEIQAYWSTGKVGMTGISYVGTQTIAAATTGVEGLETIVPEASISNWYDYYRCNGVTAPAVDWQGDDADLLAEYCLSRMYDEEDYGKIKDFYQDFLKNMRVEQDRVTGNYNKFWDERNYLNNVDKIRASVCIVHGLNDWNVKQVQFARFFEELQKHGVPSKMILHQSDHDHIDNHIGFDYNHYMNKWYGHFLYNIDNGIMEEMPNVIVQNNLDTHIWNYSNTWPHENSKYNKIYMDRNNKFSYVKENEKIIDEFRDDLSLSGFDRKEDNRDHWRDQLILKPENKREDRLAFLSEEMVDSLRISGSPKIKFRASLNKPTGILSAMLVDYGEMQRATVEKKPVVEKGINLGGNGGYYDIVDFVMEEEASPYRIITRGWMNCQNRRNNYNKDTTIAGEEYEFKFNMQPMDYTVKKGHKIGLIIYGTDADVTKRQFIVTDFKVDRNSIELELPFINELDK